MIQGVHRLIRIPAANLSIAKELLRVIADPPESAAGMFTSGFNALGTGPATHYISSGLIDARFAAILGNAPVTFSVYQSRGGTLATLADITALYAVADIRTDALGVEQTIISLLGMKPTTGVAI